MIYINRIFLDLDGVVRDWCSGIFKLFDCEPILVDTWDRITKYVCKECGISTTYFWEIQTYGFWESLKPYTYINRVLSLFPVEKVCILTSPTLTGAGGSQAWIRKNLPHLFNNKQYLIGPAKHFCANPNSLLIDDSDTNVNIFREAGGHAILFPQSWNRCSGYTEIRLEYVKDKLRDYAMLRS